MNYFHYIYLDAAIQIWKDFRFVNSSSFAMAKITLTAKFLNFLRIFHLNAAYNNIGSLLLPSWLNSRIKSVIIEHTFVPLVATEEILPKYQMACDFLIKELGKNSIGDYLEFGVSHGSSLSIMHKVLKKLKLDHVRIFGFDSFEGMPDIAAKDDGGKWKPGQFASPIEDTRRFLTEKGVNWTRTFLIKGWFSDTLTPELVEKYNIRKASLIMIDCDIYTSSIQALNFCEPLIKDKAIVFFDDWIDDKEFGEYRAWIEFLHKNPYFNSVDFGSYKPTGKLFVLTNTKA